MEAAVIEEWVEQCQNGHTRAYSRVVLAMQQRILGFLFRMTQNPEWAEEIGQEVFLRAFQKIHNYDRSKGTFSTWLFRIARNLCIDQMRKRKGRYASIDDVEPMAAEQPGPYWNAVDNELEQRIASAVECLEPAYREVFVLREYQNLPIEDVAEIIGRPLGTVKSRLYRARALLQTKLAPLLQSN